MNPAIRVVLHERSVPLLATGANDLSRGGYWINRHVRRLARLKKLVTPAWDFRFPPYRVRGDDIVLSGDRDDTTLAELGIPGVVIATPGRLLDFKRRQDLHLSRVEVMVIDEADRMLDMGFIPDVRQIIHSTPPKTKRQTMLFSATLTPDVVRLARQWTRDAVSVEIEPEQVAVDTVNQIVYIVTTKEKFPLLLNIVQRDDAQRVMVFANRRDQTRKLTELLEQYGISCALLSGDVPQTKRVKTLERFREGDFRVLVATDVAGRGIHVEGVSHVVNFTLPHDAEDYVHRIGRTGRAGATGTSISFACEADAFQIPAIEEYIGNELECVHPEDDWLVAPPPPPRSASTKRSHPPETSGSSDRRPRRRRPRRSGSSGDGGGRARAPQTR